MSNKHMYRWLMVLLCCLAGCAPAPATPTLTPTPTTIPTATLTPTITPTSTPTPTPTPLPPLWLRVDPPERISAIEPQPIQVVLAPPPNVTASATVRAVVYDPAGEVYATFEQLTPQGLRYISAQSLHLPLIPLEGAWRIVAEAHSTFEIQGEFEAIFYPTPVRFWKLGEAFPAGVTLLVPEVFVETAALGDAWAGMRAWEYAGGALEFWWAPGPTEDLLYNNALVMLEATHSETYMPEVTDEAESLWQERQAFIFSERGAGRRGGVAETWVIQGPDFWLYVLRMRSLRGENVPELIQEVGATLRF